MARLSKGPLYLAQRGTVSAVMLSNRLFDHLLKQLEDKDDLIDALKVELAIARGEDVPEPVDIVELESMIGAS
ncbi:hypothetical protein KFU94_67820 [Chloroflexi bacterium TSY]|nr:hypothetical protein [Chloroflexi bacterium TSY]